MATALEGLGAGSAYRMGALRTLDDAAAEAPPWTWTGPLTVDAVFAAQAARAPQAATIARNGGGLSYRELDACGDQVAG
jgi:non-ribosomal peptide synthetase component F